MSVQGPENRTLAECAIASARLFEAQQWKWGRQNSPLSGDLDVPDAERILQTLQGLFESAMEAALSCGEGGRSSTGRLRVEVCCDECAHSREVRCVQIWQRLGELEV